MTEQLISNRHQYKDLNSSLLKLSNTERTPLLKTLLQTDLFYLLRYGLNRPDTDNDFIFDRCREVQASPNGHLDLWAREHYKSTVITLALTIQDILNDPEITIGIFSFNQSTAGAFLRQIMVELQENEMLKEIFPDVLWADPKKQAPVWSEKSGLIVKRKSRPKESTVEAHGLVDGQPTSKHFKLMIYDDVVTRESVSTPDQINKTTTAWELSINLAAEGGAKRYIGTRYHANDTYAEMIRRGVAKPRIYAATKNGDPAGEPVLMKAESLAEKRVAMGPYTFACQMLQNPLADEVQGFKPKWINYYRDDRGTEAMNKYIVVDPASSKKKRSDYTAMFVIGCAADNNFYVLDMVRDRLNLTERTDAVFALHKRWKPQNVGYERYGMMGDIEHIKERQANEKYHFPITELGGKMAKEDRIRRLIPVFEQGRMFLPVEMSKTDYEGKTIDLINAFVNDEYAAFPVAAHDDMLDALSRLMDKDLNVRWPVAATDAKNIDRYARRPNKNRGSAWAA